MDLESLQEHVLEGLLSGEPRKAEATALRLYSEDATFKHPFFLVTGRRRIATLLAWWSRMQSHMAPKPGLTQMWVDRSSSGGGSGAGACDASVVLDLTYEATPFYYVLGKHKHVVRIVVMLHLVEAEREQGRAAADPTKRVFKIKRQEDFLQVDSLASAALPQPLSHPLILLTRLVMALWGWLICYVFAPVMVEVRAFI